MLLKLSKPLAANPLMGLDSNNMPEMMVLTVQIKNNTDI